MRLVEYKREHRLRDDAYCSDYMVLLDKLSKDIDYTRTDILAYQFDDPRESDVILQFNGETYVLPFDFLAEMLQVDYIKGIIDNLHRDPDERVYTWDLDDIYVHPLCSSCGECEKKERVYNPGTECKYKFVEVNPGEKHRWDCEEYFRNKDK